MVINPPAFLTNDENFVYPPEDPSRVEVFMGPNIKPFPKFGPLYEIIEGVVVLKVGDNITTDHIMPAGSKILPLRSNIVRDKSVCIREYGRGFPRPSP